jgi:hypothetical protein
MIIYFPARSKQGFHFRRTTFDENNSNKVDRLGQVTQADMPHTSGIADRRKPEEMETKEADFQRKKSGHNSKR